MGAHLRESISNSDCEPAGTLRVYGRRLRGTRVDGAEIPTLLDELPIIAVAAALAEGDTEIRDAQELKVKETDRITAMATNLAAFGVKVDVHDDGMTVHGGGPISGARVQSFGDHRIAMSCAVLGLFAKGETTIEDTACIATSYPTFQEDLMRIAAFRESGLASLLGTR
jgi:3-phosphoshikimate 1-carboxyvinyltransferase